MPPERRQEISFRPGEASMRRIAELAPPLGQGDAERDDTSDDEGTDDGSNRRSDSEADKRRRRRRGAGRRR